LCAVVLIIVAIVVVLFLIPGIAFAAVVHSFIVGFVISAAILGVAGALWILTVSLLLLNLILFYSILFFF